MKTLAISLLAFLTACTTKVHIGHWEASLNDAKLGIVIHDGKYCTSYFTPPNHSTFAAECKYKVEGNIYQVADIKFDGTLHESEEYIYLVEENAFIYELEGTEYKLNIVKH